MGVVDSTASAASGQFSWTWTGPDEGRKRQRLHCIRAVPQLGCDSPTLCSALARSSAVIATGLFYYLPTAPSTCTAVNDQRSIFVREENIRCAFDYFDLDGNQEVRLTQPIRFSVDFDKTAALVVCAAGSDDIIRCW